MSNAVDPNNVIFTILTTTYLDAEEKDGRYDVSTEITQVTKSELIDGHVTSEVVSNDYFNSHDVTGCRVLMIVSEVSNKDYDKPKFDYSKMGIRTVKIAHGQIRVDNSLTFKNVQLFEGFITSVMEETHIDEKDGSEKKVLKFFFTPQV